MNWLLPAQTLLELISSGSNGAHVWAASVDSRALRVSVLSIAQAQARISLETNPTQRQRYLSDLNTVLSQMEADSGLPPLSFTAEHAKIWATLCIEDSLENISQIDRCVYSTAMYEGLALVESPKPEHAALKNMGVWLNVI